MKSDFGHGSSQITIREGTRVVTGLGRLREDLSGKKLDERGVLRGKICKEKEGNTV